MNNINDILGQIWFQEILKFIFAFLLGYLLSKGN